MLPTRDDWILGELLAAQRKLFVVWSIGNGFCATRDDFATHFDVNEEFSAEIESLLADDLVNDHEGLLLLTPLSKQAVAIIEARETKESQSSPPRPEDRKQSRSGNTPQQTEFFSRDLENVFIGAAGMGGAIAVSSFDGRVATVELHGEVGTPADSGDLLERLLGAESYGHTVLLDFSDVEYIGSTGIAWLLTCHRRFEREGGRLIMHSMPTIVRDVFFIMKLERYFNVADSKAEALRMVNEERR